MKDRIYAQRKRQTDEGPSASALANSNSAQTAVQDAPVPTLNALDGHSIAHIAITPPAKAPAPALGMLSASGSDFNPESIAHDLRRAIDQSAATMDWDNKRVIRKIDAALVIRVLDNLTPSQVKTVTALYESQEKRAGSLLEDLFGGGTSDVPSSLTRDQEARIRALLRGTRSEEPGAATMSGRIEADVAELHELLSGSLNDAKRERIMALHRRPVPEIGRLDGYYQTFHGKSLPVALQDKLKDLQQVRMNWLRLGDWVKADACAIEEKRKALAKLDEQPVMPFNEDEINEKRKTLMAGIEAVVEQNRQEALTDSANVGKSSDQAVRERIAAVLAQRPGEGDVSLGDALAHTLGDKKGGAIAAMASGSLVEVAARRLLEMEASETTKTDKIVPLLRGFRALAQKDVMAKLYDPRVTQEEKLAIGGDVKSFERAVDAQAKAYTSEFVSIYDGLKGDGRSWSEIVASADSHNEDLLNELVTGGGTIEDPVVEIDIAIRKKDVETIKAILRRLPNQEAVVDVDRRYKELRGKTLREALYAGVSADAAATVDTMFTHAMVSGRSAAAVEEALQKPSEEDRGTDKEVEWIVTHGLRERWVTEETSGAMGSLREIGDDPETQVLMAESAKRLKELKAEWDKNDPWGRPRQQILLEMRRVRATLTGDATAYEEENARMVAELRSAVSFAVQIALAVAIPGGGSFLATMAMNIGANVASNMLIWGEQYTFTSFRNDILGGVLGAAGGQLGKEFAGTVASQVSGKAAAAATEAAERAGLKVALETGAEAAVATEASLGVKIAQEAGNIGGGLAGGTLATGENQFTLEGVFNAWLMNRLGEIRGGAKPGGASGEQPHTTPTGEALSTPAAAGEPTLPQPGAQSPRPAVETTVAPVVPSAPAPGVGAPGAPAPPTRRMVVIDANVLDQINRGNAQAAAALRQLAQSGEVCISRQAFNEAIVDRAIPRMAEANRRILDELGIPIAPPGTLEARTEVYARNATESRAGEGILSEKDVMTAAQAHASGAEVWSPDKAYRNNRAQVEGQLGVRVAPESGIQPIKGNEDYRVGRRLLGLPEIEISLMGEVGGRPPERPGGGSGPEGGGLAAGAGAPSAGDLVQGARRPEPGGMVINELGPPGARLPDDFVPDEIGFIAEGPHVSIPTGRSGEPANILEIGAGPGDTNLGLPMEPGQGNPAQHDPSLVNVTRTDIAPREGIGELNAEQPIPPEYWGQDTIIINNPRGYTVDVANIGEALRPGGRIIVQGRGQILEAAEPGTNVRPGEPGTYVEHLGPQPADQRPRRTNPDVDDLVQTIMTEGLPPGYELAPRTKDPTSDTDRIGGITQLPSAPIGDSRSTAKPGAIMGGPFSRTDGGGVSWPNTQVVIERTVPANEPVMRPDAETGPLSRPDPSGPETRSALDEYLGEAARRIDELTEYHGSDDYYVFNVSKPAPSESAAPAPKAIGEVILPERLRETYGMPEENQRKFQQFAEKHGVEIDLRPTAKPAPELYEKAGAVPKMEDLKAKTITKEDVPLGARPEDIGKVGFFKPNPPVRPPEKMGKEFDAEWSRIVDRFSQRDAEYWDNAQRMTELQRRVESQRPKASDTDPRGTHQEVQVVIKDGVVYAVVDDGGGFTEAPFTGDHDIFDIRKADGSPLSDTEYHAIIDEMKAAGMGVAHGAHMRWTPKTPAEQAIFDAIVNQHKPGGEVLIRFSPGGPPVTAEGK